MIISYKLFLILAAVLLLVAPAFTQPPRFRSACKNKQIQVLSDVDDTMKAAGPNFVAGCDTRWPPGSIYAGMSAFYLELSRGPKFSNIPTAIGIVSARPEQLAAAFPDLEYEFAQAAAVTGIDANVWGKVRITLPGKFRDNAHLHTHKRFIDYGNTKINNVKKFLSDKKNSDYCVIFVGDNGQGDQYAGHAMLRDNPGVAAVFIHNVTANPILKVPDIDNLFLFRTYPEAAYIAYKNGFIPKDGVRKVLESTMLSIQYKQCVDCLDVNKPCVLENTVPRFNKIDGGCTTLFHSIVNIASKIDHEHGELPSLKVSRLPAVIAAGLMWLFMCWVLNWVLFIVLSAALIFFVDRQLAKRKKTE